MLIASADAKYKVSQQIRLHSRYRNCWDFPCGLNENDFTNGGLQIKCSNSCRDLFIRNKKKHEVKVRRM